MILAFFAGGAVAFSAWMVVERMIDGRYRDAISATPPGAASVDAPQAASLNPINDVLHLWSGGEEGQAVALFMQLSRRDDRPGAYRLYELSENEFVGLAPEARSRLKSDMVPAFAEMNRFAREVLKRADAARGNRDLATCRILLRGLKRLGAANRGEDVTALSNLVGQAIEENAERALARLEG